MQATDLHGHTGLLPESRNPIIFHAMKHIPPGTTCVPGDMLFSIG